MDLENKLLEGVDAILGVDGLAARTRTDYRFSEQQFDYARRTAQGFCRTDPERRRAAINVLEAATGIGKSIGYLVPLFLYAALTGKRVAVSTFTRQLQRQLLDKDVVHVQHWVKDLTGVSLSVARRLGRGNYVAPESCARLVEAMNRELAGDLSAVEHRAIRAKLTFVEELMDWAENGQSGVVDDFLADRALDSLPAGLKYTDVCLSPDSSASDCAQYEADIATSKNVDVLIVNHALMVMHAYRWSTVLDDPEGRSIAVCVFDEADRLADAAESVLSSDLALHRLLAVATAAADVLGVQSVVKPIQQLYNRVMAQPIPVNRLAPLVRDQVLGAALQEATETMARTAVLLQNDRDLLTKVVNEAGDRAKLIGQFLDCANDLVRIRDAVAAPDNNAIVSWSPVRAYPSISVGKPNAGRIMKRLWAVRDRQDDETLPTSAWLEAVLFTSATLATPGKRYPEAFDDFAQNVGIVRFRHKNGERAGAAVHFVHTDLMFAYQPRAFGQMEFVLADPRVPAPVIKGDDEVMTNPEWLDYCASMIRAAQASPVIGGRTLGRTLVLAWSWADTQALEARLAGMRGLLVHQRGEPLRGQLVRYAETDNAVLVSPGAWEGVDLPGLVNQLVITRLPFLPPNRPEQERLRLHLSLRGYDTGSIDRLLQAMDAGATRRRLAQGIGRGLRAVGDKVRVWVADPRFPLPEEFAASLDPILLNAPSRRTNPMLRNCIPQRFRDTTYNEATFWLAEGRLHTLS